MSGAGANSSNGRWTICSIMASDLSLRPLAGGGNQRAPARLSLRLEEGLLIAAMDELQSGFRRLSRGDGGASADIPVRSTPSEVGHVASTPLSQPSLEVQVLALHQPAQYARYLKHTSASWLELIEGALPASRRSPALATLCGAVIDGLLLELLSTGDRRRTTDAIMLFGALLHKR